MPLPLWGRSEGIAAGYWNLSIVPASQSNAVNSPDSFAAAPGIVAQQEDLVEQSWGIWAPPSTCRPADRADRIVRKRVAKPPASSCLRVAGGFRSRPRTLAYPLQWPRPIASRADELADWLADWALGSPTQLATGPGFDRLTPRPACRPPTFLPRAPIELPCRLFRLFLSQINPSSRRRRQRTIAARREPGG